MIVASNKTIILLRFFIRIKIIDTNDYYRVVKQFIDHNLLEF